MNIQETRKNIDTSKMNMGIELECFIIHADTLEDIAPEKSQEIFEELKKSGWELHSSLKGNEIHSATKDIGGELMLIKLDLSYAIFEIATINPVPNLSRLEKMQSGALHDLKAALRELGLTIWPLGVAPASTGLLKLPFETKTNIMDDAFYRIVNRLDYLNRFCHMTAHQVTMDTPLPKLIPAINALFKNLGGIITEFANAPVLKNGTFYNEGRYYWWYDSNPRMKEPEMVYRAHQFPEKQFESFNDFYNRTFDGYAFVVRDGWTLTFKDQKTTIHRFLKEKTGVAIDHQGEEKEVVLQKEDIPIFLKTCWIDFKPHFDLDKRFTVEEFLEYYEKNQLDEFLEKYCVHSWIEIRPCAVHFEDNAMKVPRYFYGIFTKLDEYIKESEAITWEQAKIHTQQAIKPQDFNGRTP